MDVGNHSSRSISRAGLGRPLSALNLRGLSTPEPARPVLKVSSVETTRTFAPNASIVLVGIRGCGKTSLGYIAARALGRRLIEADDEFERKTGCSRAQFLKDRKNNAEQYRLQERQLMESMLANNETDAVIVCGVGSIESHGQALLREYALRHPVIHVVRETEFVRDWLRIPKDSSLMSRLEDSDRKHRICSNFEFYNLFDGGVNACEIEGRVSKDASLGQRSPRYAGTLQRTQQDFIRFVNLIMGLPDPSLQELNAKIIAAAVSPEDKVYTYALAVEFSQIADGSLDLIELECGADVIELRMCASDIIGQSLAVDSTWVTKLSQQFAALRRKVAAPMIFNVNWPSFESLKAGNMSKDETYLELLHLGTRLGAEYVVVDLNFDDSRLQQFLRAKGSTKIIGESFDDSPLGWDDPVRLSKYQRAIRIPCDIVRLSQFAKSDEDNIAIRRFQKSAAQAKTENPQRSLPPLIAYNVGRLGRASMCSNTMLIPVTHPAIRVRKTNDYNDLLTMQEASKMTYDLGILDPLKFCTFGASTLYSLSPAMHKAAYDACGLPHDYDVFQSSNLHDLDGIISDPSFGGAAITLPFKTEVIKVLKSLSPEAQAIGAVNTILPIREPASSTVSDERRIQRSRAGPVTAWHGANTDWVGITTCVKRHLSPANMIRPRTAALVLGAGGMARAAIYALIRLDVPNIFIYNRTVKHADALATHFNELAVRYRGATGRTSCRNEQRIMVIASMHDLWPTGFEQPTIVVSCVPAHSIGTVPSANLTLPLGWLQSVNGGVFLELAYKPRKTPLLSQIEHLRESGRPWVPVHGLEHLPEQGIASFQLMTGRTAPRHLMRAEVVRHYVSETGQHLQVDGQRSSSSLG
ncbi:Quinate repressor [Hyphodiscus hymeniophilus]|uniref:Quinate repressor n=1 Tax=Hyphodiscus hymeniophilus TaxID=353542 RepID=A0A9P6VPH5_9HELO|nr:Quinate repressor [Hyphodiscus hymeniophilus]